MTMRLSDRLGGRGARLAQALSDRNGGEKPRWRRVLRGVADAVYPPRCMACTDLTDAPSGLCAACWAGVSFITGPACDRCGTPVPTGLGSDRVLCDGCDATPPAWDRGRAALLYDGTGRRIVLGLKHGDRLDTAPELARWMRRAGGALLTPGTLLVPVPLHWRRLLKRKYNQASELARHVARGTGATPLPDALHRVRPTPPLKGLRREERRQVLAGALQVNPDRAARLSGGTVVLVDDVMTSGATLAAATDVLHDAGAARVSVLTLARVARPA